MEIVLNLISEYGYLALFFVILLAGTYLPIPAGLILIIVGAAFHGQPIHLIITFFVAVAASMIDDLIIYMIARKIGSKGAHERFINRSRMAQKLESFTSRHPRLAIFTSRFIGFARVPVSALSGLSGVHVRTFVPFATLGSMLCIMVYLAVGYSLGYIWEVDVKTAGTIVSTTFLVLALGSLAWFWYTRRRKRSHELQASSNTG